MAFRIVGVKTNYSTKEIVWGFFWKGGCTCTRGTPPPLATALVTYNSDRVFLAQLKFILNYFKSQRNISPKQQHMFKIKTIDHISPKWLYPCIIHAPGLKIFWRRLLSFSHAVVLAPLALGVHVAYTSYRSLHAYEHFKGLIYLLYT